MSGTKSLTEQPITMTEAVTWLQLQDMVLDLDIDRLSRRAAEFAEGDDERGVQECRDDMREKVRHRAIVHWILGHLSQTKARRTTWWTRVRRWFR